MLKLTSNRFLSFLQWTFFADSFSCTRSKQFPSNAPVSPEKEKRRKKKAKQKRFPTCPYGSRNSLADLSTGNKPWNYWNVSTKARFRIPWTLTHRRSPVTNEITRRVIDLRHDARRRDAACTRVYICIHGSDDLTADQFSRNDLRSVDRRKWKSSPKAMTRVSRLLITITKLIFFAHPSLFPDLSYIYFFHLVTYHIVIALPRITSLRFNKKKKKKYGRFSIGFIRNQFLLQLISGM